MRALRPTFFFAPPAIWASLYAEFTHRTAGLHADDPRTVSARSDVACLLGDRVQWIGTGGAATSAAVLQFMHDTWRLPVLEGYGATEVGGIASNGKLDSRVQIRLLDVPELGYFAADLPLARGELCVKSPIRFVPSCIHLHTDVCSRVCMHVCVQCVRVCVRVCVRIPFSRLLLGVAKQRSYSFVFQMCMRVQVCGYVCCVHQT